MIFLLIFAVIAFCVLCWIAGMVLMAVAWPILIPTAFIYLGVKVLRSGQSHDARAI